MARTYYKNRSAGDVSTTSNTVWSDVVTLTFTPDASTDYWFHWYGDFRVVSTSSDVQVRVYDGTTALDTSNYEARDTSPNEYKTLSGVFKYTSGGSPTSTSFKIQVKAETSGVTVSGRNGQLVAIKAISTDQWVETTANSAPSGADATIQTLTWTPDQTRDYIMVGSASAGGTSSASDERLRISRGSDSATMASCGITAFKDSTSRLTVMVAAYLAGLTAVSQTYRLKYDNAGGTVTCINNRLLALDVTGENVYSQANTDGSSNNTGTYADCVTYSPTIANTAEHLIFACGVKNTASSTVSGYVQSLVDGSVVAESVEEHDASNCDFPHCWVWLGSLTSGSRTIKNQAKNESGTVVVNVLQQGYVVWDIQTGATPSGAISGTTTLTFSPTAGLAGAGALAGAAAVAFAPAATIIGQAPISGAAAVAFDATGTGTLWAFGSGAAAIAFTPSATLLGGGALAGATSVTLTPAGNLIGAAPIAGSVSAAFAATATLLGAGALSGSTATAFDATGNLEALSGAISGTCGVAFSSISTLIGDGALAGTTAASFTPAGLLVGDGVLVGTAPIAWNVSATLLGTGTLAGAVQASFDLSGLLAGSGALAGAPALQFSPAGQLIGEAPVSGSASVLFTPTGDLQSLAAGEISGSVSITFSASAGLVGEGVLSGVATLLFSPSGMLSGLVAAVGDASFAFNVAGSLEGVGNLNGTTGPAFLPAGSLLGAGALVGGIEWNFAVLGSIYDDSYWLQHGSAARTGGVTAIEVASVHERINNVYNTQLILASPSRAQVDIQPGSPQVTIQ